MNRILAFLFCMSFSGLRAAEVGEGVPRYGETSSLAQGIFWANTGVELKELSHENSDAFYGAISETTYYGETPLIDSIQKGNLEKVEVLLSCCGQILKNKTRGRRGLSPFQLALQLSAMKSTDYSTTYPKSGDRRKILDLFINDPEVIVKPISRDVWGGKARKTDEWYMTAMNTFESDVVPKVDSSRISYSDYKVPERGWFSEGRFGNKSYREDVERYNRLIKTSEE